MAQVYYCVVFCDKLGISSSVFTVENRLLHCHRCIHQLNMPLPCLKVRVQVSSAVWGQWLPIQRVTTFFFFGSKLLTLHCVGNLCLWARSRGCCGFCRSWELGHSWLSSVATGSYTFGKKFCIPSCKMSPKLSLSSSGLPLCSYSYSKGSYSKCKRSQSGYHLVIHVLEKHGFPVSIVDTLFLAVCLEQWLGVWEMLATEGICLFFFFSNKQKY